MPRVLSNIVLCASKPAYSTHVTYRPSHCLENSLARSPRLLLELRPEQTLWPYGARGMDSYAGAGWASQLL